MSLGRFYTLALLCCSEGTRKPFEKGKANLRTSSDVMNEGRLTVKRVITDERSGDNVLVVERDGEVLNPRKIRVISVDTSTGDMLVEINGEEHKSVDAKTGHTLVEIKGEKHIVRNEADLAEKLASAEKRSDIKQELDIVGPRLGPTRVGASGSPTTSGTCIKPPPPIQSHSSGPVDMGDLYPAQEPAGSKLTDWQRLNRDYTSDVLRFLTKSQKELISTAIQATDGKDWRTKNMRNVYLANAFGVERQKMTDLLYEFRRKQEEDPNYVTADGPMDHESRYSVETLNRDFPPDKFDRSIFGWMRPDETPGKNGKFRGGKKIWGTLSAEKQAFVLETHYASAFVEHALGVSKQDVSKWREPNRIE